MASPALLSSKIPNKILTTWPRAGRAEAEPKGFGAGLIAGIWADRRYHPRGHARWRRDGGDGWGITVYPARGEGDRWRAVWSEGGRRREGESVSEPGLAAKLVKVAERLSCDAPGLEEPGSELIAHYLVTGPAPGR